MWRVLVDTKVLVNNWQSSIYNSHVMFLLMMIFKSMYLNDFHVLIITVSKHTAVLTESLYSFNSYSKSSILNWYIIWWWVRSQISSNKKPELNILNYFCFITQKTLHLKNPKKWYILFIYEDSKASFPRRYLSPPLDK